MSPKLHPALNWLLGVILSYMVRKVPHNPNSSLHRRRIEELKVSRMQSFPKNRRLIERSSLIWTIVVFVFACSILFLIGDSEQVMEWLKY